jgi:hypothetical protein
VAKEYFGFAGPSHEISVGFKWRVTPNTILEFAVVENILIYNNSRNIGANLCLGFNL